jgi:hypothetical protein
MATRIDQLFYTLDMQRQGFDRAVADVQRQLKRMGRDSGKAAGGISRIEKDMRRAARTTDLFSKALKAVGLILGARLLGRFVRRVSELGTELLRVSSEIQEVGSRFDAVFGTQAQPLLDRLAEFRRLAGLTTTELKDLAGSTGDILTGFGFTEKAAADLSEQVIRAAGDLASFTNVPVADATQRITKSLTGSAEAMDGLGIVVRDAQVRLIAFAQTGKRVARELTLQDKAAARLALIQQQMVASTGDLVRTQGSMANRLRRSSARLREMREAVAVLLTPAFVRLVEVIDTEVGPAIDSLTEILEGNLPTVKAGALALGRAIGAAIAIGINEGLTFALRELPNVFLKRLPGDFAERLPKPTDLTAKLIEGSIDDARELLERSIQELQAIAAQARADVARRARERGRPPEEPSADPSIEDVAESADNAKKIETLRRQLADRIASITLTSAEQQIRIVRRMRQAFETEYQKLGEAIPKSIEESLRLAEEAAAEGLQLEKARQSADQFRTEMEEGFRQITLLSEDFTDEEERRAFVLEQQVRLLEITRHKAEQRVDAAETTKEEEEAIRDVIAEIVALLITARDTQSDIADDAEREKDAAEERFRQLQHTLSLIHQSVNGALELANAFGLVNDEMTDSIRSLEQIGSGIATLAASIPTGNIPGIVAGGLGIAGGIAGLFAKGPEDAERARLIEANTAALKELIATVDRLQGSFDIPGRFFTDIPRGLEGLLSEPGAFRHGFDPDALRRQLGDLGLTFGDLERAAEEMGIDLGELGSAASTDALKRLVEALEIARASFIGFPDTIEGTLRRLQIEFELFDVDDPVKQLQRIAGELAALTKVGEGVPALQKLFGLDFTTAEGRAQGEALIRTLYQQLVAGVITPAQLGAATFEEAIEILKLMEALLDDIEANTEAAAAVEEGTTRQVSFSTRVTEAQGDAFLSRFDTMLFLDRHRNDLLGSILEALGARAITRIMPPAAASAVTNNIDVVFQDVDIQITGMEDGQEAAEVFIEEIDRRIGERLLRQRRIAGLN